MSGAIAGLSIWNEALTQDEIKALATGMPPGYIRPWALWQWDFNGADAEISKGCSQIALQNVNGVAVAENPPQLWVPRKRSRVYVQAPAVYVAPRPYTVNQTVTRASYW
jgi:hypothetical protein